MFFSRFNSSGEHPRLLSSCTNSSILQIFQEIWGNSLCKDVKVSSSCIEIKGKWTSVFSSMCYLGPTCIASTPAQAFSPSFALQLSKGPSAQARKGSTWSLSKAAPVAHSQNLGWWHGFISLPLWWFYTDAVGKETHHLHCWGWREKKEKGNVHTCLDCSTFRHIQIYGECVSQNICNPIPSEA